MLTCQAVRSTGTTLASVPSCIAAAALMNRPACSVMVGLSAELHAAWHSIPKAGCQLAWTPAQHLHRAACRLLAWYSSSSESIVCVHANFNFCCCAGTQRHHVLPSRRVGGRGKTGFVLEDSTGHWSDFAPCLGSCKPLVWSSFALFSVFLQSAPSTHRSTGVHGKINSGWGGGWDGPVPGLRGC